MISLLRAALWAGPGRRPAYLHELLAGLQLLASEQQHEVLLCGQDMGQLQKSQTAVISASRSRAFPPLGLSGTQERSIAQETGRGQTLGPTQFLTQLCS